MERRQRAIQRINYALNLVATSVKSANQLNLTDINIVAEDFFLKLFNIVYGYDLKNANVYRQNESAIDLLYAKEKIAFQITSQNRTTKIASTVEKFIESEKYKSCTEFTIFTITTDKKCSDDGLDKLDSYNVKSAYKNVNDLRKEIILPFDTDKLEQIAEYLEYETTPYLKFKSFNQAKVDENLKSLHIVDQIYEVLGYFEGFELIHPQTLSRIFPFNVEERSYDPYANYCLKTNNIAIHELLLKVNIDKEGTVQIQNEELNVHKDKLREIFVKLNHSLINCICYRERFTEVQHHNIKVIKNIRDCDCNQCRFQRFQVQPLFDLLREKSVFHSENLSQALNEGYYLCKLGKPVDGWRIFYSVAKEAFEKKKFNSYFLAQFNSLAILNFIDAPWWANEAKAIVPLLREIDLQNIVSQYPMPVVVRDELIKIKEKHHLNQSREKIEEYSDSLRRVRTIYTKRGFSSSATALQLLRQEIYLLFRFYSSNSIVADDFSLFRNTMTKAIEALVISYTTDKRCKNRYKSFDSFVLMMMIFYVEEEALNRIFKAYNVRSIIIEQREKKRFIELISNFFSCQVTSHSFQPQYAEDIKKQDFFSHFRQSLRHQFSRVMLVLSKATIAADDFIPIAASFATFIQAAEDLNQSSWELIVQMFNKQAAGFSEDQIKIIIEQTVAGTLHHNGDYVLQSMCDIAAKKTGFVATDPAFFKKIMNRISQLCLKCGSIHDMSQTIAIWNIADPENQQLIKQNAIEYLEKSFDADFYESAVFLEIFDKNETFFLNQYIHYAKEHCSRFDIRKEKDHWIFQSYIGYNCINCLLFMDIDLQKEKVLEEVKNVSDYYNWLINSETYDYTDFDFKWLIEACPHNLKIKLFANAHLKDKVKQRLLQKYDDALAIFYTKYLLKEK